MFQSWSVILVLNLVIISAVSLFPHVRVVNTTLMNPSAGVVVQTGAGEGWRLHQEAQVGGPGPLHQSLAQNRGSDSLRGSHCPHLHVREILIPLCQERTQGSPWHWIVCMGQLVTPMGTRNTRLLPWEDLLVC